jgi:hypothetical protein
MQRDQAHNALVYKERSNQLCRDYNCPWDYEIMCNLTNPELLTAYGTPAIASYQNRMYVLYKDENGWLSYESTPDLSGCAASPDVGRPCANWTTRIGGFANEQPSGSFALAAGTDGYLHFVYTLAGTTIQKWGHIYRYGGNDYMYTATTMPVTYRQAMQGYRATLVDSAPAVPGTTLLLTFVGTDGYVYSGWYTAGTGWGEAYPIRKSGDNLFVAAVGSGPSLAGGYGSVKMAVNMADGIHVMTYVPGADRWQDDLATNWKNPYGVEGTRIVPYAGSDFALAVSSNMHNWFLYYKNNDSNGYGYMDMSIDDRSNGKYMYWRQRQTMVYEASWSNGLGQMSGIPDHGLSAAAMGANVWAVFDTTDHVTYKPGGQVVCSGLSLPHRIFYAPKASAVEDAGVCDYNDWLMVQRGSTVPVDAYCSMCYLAPSTNCAGCLSPPW